MANTQTMINNFTKIIENNNLDTKNLSENNLMGFDLMSNNIFNNVSLIKTKNNNLRRDKSNFWALKALELTNNKDDYNYIMSKKNYEREEEFNKLRQLLVSNRGLDNNFDTDFNNTIELKEEIKNNNIQNNANMLNNKDILNLNVDKVIIRKNEEELDNNDVIDEELEVEESLEDIESDHETVIEESESELYEEMEEEQNEKNINRVKNLLIENNILTKKTFKNLYRFSNENKLIIFTIILISLYILIL